MRLTRKHLERLAMALIMAFPVSYLFFTQIFALAGAHGEEIFADNGQVIIRYEEKKFAQLMPETRVQLSEGAWSTYTSVNIADYGVGTYLLVWNQEFNLDSNTRNTFIHSWANANYVFNSAQTNFNLTAGMKTWRFNFTSVHNYTFTYWAQSFNPSFSTTDYYIGNAMLFPLTWMYGAGNEPTTENFLIDYPEVWYSQNLGSVEEVPVYGEGTYGQELTQNFFPKNNFLEQIGRNALSETPHGFAPFASMIKYLDVNMLHLGEKNYGLMAYGQLYYMLNVSVFYLIYKTMVFIPNMITKLFNWFGKENENND